MQADQQQHQKEEGWEEGLQNRESRPLGFNYRRSDFTSNWSLASSTAADSLTSSRLPSASTGGRPSPGVAHIYRWSGLLSNQSGISRDSGVSSDQDGESFATSAAAPVIKDHRSTPVPASSPSSRQPPKAAIGVQSFPQQVSLQEELRDVHHDFRESTRQHDNTLQRAIVRAGCHDNSETLGGMRYGLAAVEGEEGDSGEEMVLVRRSELDNFIQHWHRVEQQHQQTQDQLLELRLHFHQVIGVPLPPPPRSGGERFARPTVYHNHPHPYHQLRTNLSMARSQAADEEQQQQHANQEAKHITIVSRGTMTPPDQRTTPPDQRTTPPEHDTTPSKYVNPNGQSTKSQTKKSTDQRKVLPEIPNKNSQRSQRTNLSASPFSQSSRPKKSRKSQVDHITMSNIVTSCRKATNFSATTAFQNPTTNPLPATTTTTTTTTIESASEDDSKPTPVLPTSPEARKGSPPPLRTPSPALPPLTRISSTAVQRYTIDTDTPLSPPPTCPPFGHGTSTWAQPPTTTTPAKRVPKRSSSSSENGDHCTASPSCTSPPPSTGGQEGKSPPAQLQTPQPPALPLTPSESLPLCPPLLPSVTTPARIHPASRTSSGGGVQSHQQRVPTSPNHHHFSPSPSSSDSSSTLSTIDILSPPTSPPITSPKPRPLLPRATPPTSPPTVSDIYTRRPRVVSSPQSPPEKRTEKRIS